MIIIEGVKLERCCDSPLPSLGVFSRSRTSFSGCEDMYAGMATGATVRECAVCRVQSLHIALCAMHTHAHILESQPERPLPPQSCTNCHKTCTQQTAVLRSRAGRRGNGRHSGTRSRGLGSDTSRAHWNQAGRDRCVCVVCKDVVCNSFVHLPLLRHAPNR